MIDTIKLTYLFSDNEYNKTLDHLYGQFSSNSEIRLLHPLNNGKINEVSSVTIFNTPIMNIYMNKDYINIKTSLWKLYLGNNVDDFNISGIMDSVNLLQKIIPTINLMESQCTLIHIGPSLAVKKNPDLYVDALGGKEKMTWINYENKGNSKCIGSKKNYVIVYNKSKESNVSDKKNVLRLEYRIESSYWFKKYFGSTKPKLSYLLNNIDVIYLIWYEQYKKLVKDYSNDATYVESIHELTSFAINEYGYEKCTKIINDSFKLGKMSLWQKNYAIKRIKELKRKKNVVIESECCATELDNAVEKFMTISVKAHNTNA